MFTIQHYKSRLIKNGTRKYPREILKSSDDAAALFIDLLKDLPHEEVVVVYLNGLNKILGTMTISMGGLHGAALTPRDVFRGAIAANASAIIMAHNHPSGDPTPSKEDIIMTQKVKEAGEVIGIEILDHLVISGTEYRSCNES